MKGMWCVRNEEVRRRALIKGEKVKPPMARSLPVENLPPQNVGSIVNYLQ